MHTSRMWRAVKSSKQRFTLVSLSEPRVAGSLELACRGALASGITDRAVGGIFACFMKLRQLRLPEVPTFPR